LFAKKSYFQEKVNINKKLLTMEEKEENFPSFVSIEFNPIFKAKSKSEHNEFVIIWKHGKLTYCKSVNSAGT